MKIKFELGEDLKLRAYYLTQLINMCDVECTDCIELTFEKKMSLYAKRAFSMFLEADISHYEHLVKERSFDYETEDEDEEGQECFSEHCGQDEEN